MAKTELLVIDEWLRDLLDHAQAREMLDILDDRYRKGSTIFCSQLPVTEWHPRIDDPTIADAILDRIVHDSMRIELDGQSMPKKTSTIASDKASLRSVLLTSEPGEIYIVTWGAEANENHWPKKREYPNNHKF